MASPLNLLLAYAIGLQLILRSGIAASSAIADSEIPGYDSRHYLDWVVVLELLDDEFDCSSVICESFWLPD